MVRPDYARFVIRYNSKLAIFYSYLQTMQMNIFVEFAFVI